MSITSINDAAKPLRDNWEKIKSEYSIRNAGKHLVLTCVLREPSEQIELFKKGRTELSPGNWVVTDKSQVVTNVDGYKNVGAHNYKPSRAIDVAVVDDKTGKVTWEENYYNCLVEIAGGLGLESGGAWKSIKDFPHIQVPDFHNYKEI